MKEFVIGLVNDLLLIGTVCGLFLAALYLTYDYSTVSFGHPVACFRIQ